MSPLMVILGLLLATVALSAVCHAEPVMPQAPATLSWIPHGYGGNMHLEDTLCTSRKGLHGFRDTPVHIGSWSAPLWGWDVNGYYCGPQEPQPDPADFQLPIGLIYPENGPALPPGRHVRNISGGLR
jgi:hypothetical protein